MFGPPEKNVTGSIALPVSDFVYRTVRIPNDLAYIMAFNGALAGLGNSTAYQQIDENDHTPEQAAALMRDVLDSMGTGGTMEIGSVVMGLFNTPPDGWLLCDGSSYSMSEYTALMDNYPVELQNNPSTGLFTVPDFVGIVPVGAGVDALGEAWPNNRTGGERQHTLTIDEMPNHQHQYRGRPQAGTNQGSWAFGAGSSTEYVKYVDATGGGLPHNNMQPHRAISFYLVARNG